MGSIDKACISGFLCRLCSEMHRIVIHIYGDQGKRLCLVEKINGYLPITISPSDPLPKTICETCLRRVEQHYDLLMRLSRIKQKHFLRINKPQPSFRNPESVSSTDASEDETCDVDYRSRSMGTSAIVSIPSASASNNSAVDSTLGTDELLPTQSTQLTLSRNAENRGEPND